MSVSCQAQKGTDKTDGKTSKESTPRHHYERTTGTTGGTDSSQHQAAGLPHDTFHLLILIHLCCHPYKHSFVHRYVLWYFDIRIFFVSSLVI